MIDFSTDNMCECFGSNKWCLTSNCGPYLKKLDLGQSHDGKTMKSSLGDSSKEQVWVYSCPTTLCRILLRDWNINIIQIFITNDIYDDLLCLCINIFATSIPPLHIIELLMLQMRDPKTKYGIEKLSMTTWQIADLMQLTDRWSLIIWQNLSLIQNAELAVSTKYVKSYIF